MAKPVGPRSSGRARPRRWRIAPEAHQPADGPRWSGAAALRRRRSARPSAAARGSAGGEGLELVARAAPGSTRISSWVARWRRRHDCGSGAAALSDGGALLLARQAANRAHRARRSRARREAARMRDSTWPAGPSRPGPPSSSRPPASKPAMPMPETAGRGPATARSSACRARGHGNARRPGVQPTASASCVPEPKPACGGSASAAQAQRETTRAGRWFTQQAQAAARRRPSSASAAPAVSALSASCLHDGRARAPVRSQPAIDQADGAERSPPQRAGGIDEAARS